MPDPIPAQNAVLALFPAVIAGSVAVAGVMLTHQFTRAREERARLLREKSEAYLGALEAMRELAVVKESATRSSALSMFAVNRRSSVGKDVNNMRELLEKNEVAKKVAHELVDDYGKRAAGHLDTLEDLAIQEGRAIKALDYWLTRVEIACSSDGFERLTALVSAQGTPLEHQFRKEFIAAVKRELQPPGILARLGEKVLWLTTRPRKADELPEASDDTPGTSNEAPAPSKESAQGG